MIRWLCIEAAFLGGRYHGLRRGGREPEWPPAPHRLFQAMIAAAHLGARTKEWSDEKAAAFRWLESRDQPPEILAPPVTMASSVTLSVPNNDMDILAKAWVRGRDPAKQASELRTMKTLRPQLVGGDATVRFLWPISEVEWPSARPSVEFLCDEARHLHHLGLGIDLVVGNGRLLDEPTKRGLPGEIWVADPSGDLARAPTTGSLDEILARHVAFTRRVTDGVVDPATPPSQVRWVTYRRLADGDARPVYAFTLVRSDGMATSFDARRTVHIAAWLRHTAHERARRAGLDGAFIDGFVCGHGETANEKATRFSYLPLPSVGHQHVDGRIRRAFLVEPFGAREERAGVVARALRNASLISEDGEVMAELRAVGVADDSDRVFAMYRGPARIWGSVTPVILPGLDDKRSRKAVALVAKALAQAGYTTPVIEILVQTEPVFPGADLARHYLVPGHLNRWPRVHAIVTFDRPVPGPIAIGAGRHSGLGVCATLAGS